MSTENQPTNQNEEEHNKKIKRNVQYCRMFDVFVKDIKNEDDKNG